MHIGLYKGWRKAFLQCSSTMGHLVCGVQETRSTVWLLQCDTRYNLQTTAAPSTTLCAPHQKQELCSEQSADIQGEAWEARLTWRLSCITSFSRSLRQSAKSRVDFSIWRIRLTCIIPSTPWLLAKTKLKGHGLAADQRQNTYCHVGKTFLEQVGPAVRTVSHRQ